MLSKKVAIALVAGACVVSGLAGAYIALETGAVRGASLPQAASANTATNPAGNSPAGSPSFVPAAAPGVDPGKPAESPGVAVASSSRTATPVAPAGQARTPNPGRPSMRQDTPVREVGPDSRPSTSEVESVPVNLPPPAASSAAQPAPTATAQGAGGTDAAPSSQAPMLEELVVPADAVLGLQLETTVSSERARVEDQVEARVVRMVLVGGRVAIPEGARVLGSVTHVERGGKVKGQGRLTVRFHTLLLADGAQVQIKTDPVFREGVQPGKGAATKIGGAAVGGALLGALIGGGKGAAIGGAIGAAGGTAATLSGDRSEAVLLSGTSVTVRMLAPVSIVVDR
jgi:type IV secretory pathway VirB10-like protein